MLRRLYAYFRPHLASLVLATGCMALVSFSIGVQVFLIRYVLDGLLIRQDRLLLSLLPFAIVFFYSLQALGEVGRGYFTRRVSLRIVLELRNQLYRQYQRLSIAYFQARSAGRMMARVTHDVEAVQCATTVLITLLQKPLTLAVLLAAAAWQAPRLTLMALVGLPLVLWPINRLGKRLRANTRQAMDAMGNLNALLQESILGARIIRAFGMEDYEVARFEQESHRQYRLSLQKTIAMLLSGPIVQIVASFGAAAIVWYGGLAVIDGRSTPGALLAFLISLGLMYDPIKSLAKVPMLLGQARVGMERVLEILDTEPTIRDAPDAKPLEARRCHLCLKHVTFGYEDKPVLSDVSFEVEPGTTVALVGPSGAGKSSLLNLILRFFDVNSGSIEINGLDIRSLTVASLRQHVGIVTQDTFLFNDSIRNNIAYGRPDCPSSQLNEAARLAYAEKFIEKLPQGYDTQVGDLGHKLSGGEGQRIAIARALLEDAPILLLDEATASLDQYAEEEVQKALEQLMVDRTTLVVAHRLSTVRNADRIVVLDGGRVVETGNHDSLMARKGLYAKMYSRQMRGAPTGQPLEGEGG